MFSISFDDFMEAVDASIEYEKFVRENPQNSADNHRFEDHFFAQIINPYTPKSNDKKE